MVQAQEGVAHRSQEILDAETPRPETKVSPHPSWMPSSCQQSYRVAQAQRAPTPSGELHRLGKAPRMAAHRQRMAGTVTAWRLVAWRQPHSCCCRARLPEGASTGASLRSCRYAQSPRRACSQQWVPGPRPPVRPGPHLPAWRAQQHRRPPARQMQLQPGARALPAPRARSRLALRAS